MEQRVRTLLQARIKSSGWTLPERASLLQEILAEKDAAPIKPLPIPRRRLQKVAAADDKENSANEDINVTRCDPAGPSSKRAQRLLEDVSSEEKEASPAVPTRPIIPHMSDASPALSPIGAKPSPTRDADLHRQQLLELANDIENFRLSVGNNPPAQDTEGDSSTASENASTSVQAESATPVKPSNKPEQRDDTAAVAVPATPCPSAEPPFSNPNAAGKAHNKKLATDEPSEGSVVEQEEEAVRSDDIPKEGCYTDQVGDYANSFCSDAVIVPPACSSISVDEDADEQAAMARRLLENDAIFNSPIRAVSPAADSPIVVRRAAGPRRVLLSESDEAETPVASKLRMAQTREECEAADEAPRKSASATQPTKAMESDEAEDEAEEAEEAGEDESEDDEEEDEEEMERKRPKNFFIDSEAEESSTPDKKPIERRKSRKSRKSDVWIVDDDANETVLSEDEDEDEGEPAGETLHSSDSSEEKEETAMPKADEDEVPKTPAKKTATSQPIFQTPVSKIVGSINTPLAHAPGTHFQRQKAALTASLYAEYNKKVFGGKLDPAMTINWTNKLKTTAGRTLLKRRGEARFAEVELENKVVDCEEKLRRTLLHELCHAAAWVIDNCSRPPHGKTFWKWAAVAKKSYPHHEVRTCHSYVINFKHHWTCTRCSRVVGRHSKSIKATDRCACGGELKYQVLLKTDGTPRQPAAANVYTQFVKHNFAAIKANNPGATHAQVMQKVSEEYKKTPRKGTA